MEGTWPFREFRKRVLNTLNLGEREALLLAAPANITYITGAREPTGALLLSDECGDVLVTALLDYHRMLTQVPTDIEVYAVGRPGEEALRPRGIPTIEGSSLPDALARLVSKCNISKVHFDKEWLREQTVGPLRKKLTDAGVELADASTTISKVRSIKSQFELKLIVKAIEIAEAALSKLLYGLQSEWTEAKAAGTIYQSIFENGGWGPSFPPIVAFHENSAYPHHTPGARRLGPGGPILVDLGATFSGFMSDMTRVTYVGGAPPSRFREVLEAVLEAQETAIDAITPGATSGDVDRSARVVLDRRGLSEFFIHGLGHGVGVEIHERPFLRPGSKEELDPGMVVTVEPGVYIPGLFGVRIEDMVLVTERGRRVLTRFSKILL